MKQNKFKGSLLLLYIALLLIIPASSLKAQLADTPWPCSGGNAQRTGLSKYDTSLVDGTLLWKQELPASMTPLIGYDDTLYLYKTITEPNDDLMWISQDFYTYHLPTQSMQSFFEITETKNNAGISSLFSTPTLGADGTLYIPTHHPIYNASLYVVGSTGKLSWKFDVDSMAVSEPMIGGDGTVYVNSTHWSRRGDDFDHHLFALDPQDGSVKWSHNIGSTCSGPGIGKDGTVYTAGTEGVFAFYPNGKVKWQYQEALWNLGPIADDGTVYAASVDHYGELHAINSDGTLRWKFQSPDEIEDYPANFYANPSLGPDGTVYLMTYGTRQINSEVNHLFALHPDNGETRWKYDFRVKPYSNIAIGAEGTLYFADGNRLIAMNEKGQELWSHEVEAMILGRIMIGTGGTIYFFDAYSDYNPNRNYHLFAFGNKDDPSIEKLKELIEEEVETKKTEKVVETKPEGKAKTKDETSPLSIIIFLAPASGILIVLGILGVKRKKQLNVKKVKLNP